MRIIWDLGEATGKQIQDALPGHPHYNTVLTIIRVLQRKGHLTHRAQGRTFIYRAKVSREKSCRRLLSQLVNQVFGGSAASVVLGLVEAGDLTEDDLDAIRERLNRSSGKEE
jgi:predicted transcriptional regulator